MTKSRKYILGSLLALVVVGLAAIAANSYFTRSVITVENQSTAVLTGVEVTLADQVIWSGDIAPGATQTAYGHVERRGPVGISFQAGDRHVARLFGDATPDRPEHGTLAVQPNFNVEYLWLD